jgi:hypothetical protein
MLNRLNRQKSSTTAAAAAYTQPPLADWRNRKINDIQRNPATKQDPVTRRNRKLKYLELFFFAVVISMIVGVDVSIFSINKRLNALEGGLVEVKDWAFPASLLESKYTALNARVRTLNQALNGLDAKLTSVTSQQAVTAAPGDEAITFTKADIPSEAPAAGIAKPSAGIVSDTAGIDEITSELTGIIAKSDDKGAPAATQHQTVLSGLTNDATAALNSVEEIPIEASMGEPAISPSPAPSVTATNANPPQASLKGGRWIINLLSDPNEALAKRFATRARDHGVSVEQNRTEVKGRVFWRVQITGFETAREARAHAEEIKAKLHLKDVWIFKEQG